jgi:hypothetical protein
LVFFGSIVGGTLLAFLRPQARAKVPQRTLTFAERVAYPRAIEEVFVSTASGRRIIRSRNRRLMRSYRVHRLIPTRILDKLVAQFFGIKRRRQDKPSNREI